MNQSLEALLPHLASVRVTSVDTSVDAAVLVVASIAPTAECPRCGVASARTHGGYRRTLADLPIAGRGWKWALMPGGRDLLLDLTRKLPDPEIPTLTALGMDDFALRRGHRYGTIRSPWVHRD